MKSLDDWLKKHTFHHSQFNDLKELVALKERLQLSISLCFPTLNEEKTIGKEVVIMKSELMDRYPLLDEIAVIDSGSTDNTREIAEAFGAKVFLASDYLKEMGELRGKGENLWKALYLLSGDIIVYIDADISNIHPKFVYGLLGPMLTNTEIKFCKAFYERPLAMEGGTLSEGGGGRVTEILIRPLFAQFFPELTGIIQPLSGEFAGYREIFEQLSFPVGYGVETSLLIDISQKFGLETMAQTDLDKRIHRNQQTKALGRMSFGILQTFWNRLNALKGVDHLVPDSFVMNQIEVETEPRMVGQEIREHERPPMLQVESYRRQRATWAREANTA
ncbi:glucosyl-3-phosphoglycerate synthase [Candidatus Entotheonella serta]|nr:glucosyl-3-phosphoglycerate synthase [Candidatus Entotheonella serta]